MNGERIDIKQLRKELNWSQEALAEHLGVDRSSVSRMENGQEPSGPTRKLLQQLAAQRHDESTDGVTRQNEAAQ